MPPPLVVFEYEAACSKNELADGMIGMSVDSLNAYLIIMYAALTYFLG